MRNSRFVIVAAAIVVMGLLGAASVARGNVPYTTYLTFSGPFALPGVSLPAGTYLFEVMQPTGNALVRVRSHNGRTVYFAGFTRTIRRPTAQGGDVQLLFNEVPPGVTPSVRVWYPRGDPAGHEFMYPPRDAAR
jgi:hypothetical protein